MSFIIVQLTGGLGNQLFQYATGRTLSLKNGAELRLDLSFFENYKWHEYSLGPLNIKENFSTKEEINNLQLSEAGLFFKLKRKLSGGQPVTLHERSLLFHPDYLAITAPAYLKGYWQCEKYFSDQENLLRQEFEVRIPPSGPNRALLKQIRETQAVSLHIRRGNFARVDFVNKVHGTCPMDYYKAATDYISQYCTDPVFYIFSDDIPWAKENLKIPFPTVFADLNDDKTDYEDLRLMQNCKHHILANSTFSWWGAWLNPSPHKIVIAPKQWFSDPEKNKESINIIPERWIRL
jgi:hypothetical protein